MYYKISQYLKFVLLPILCWSCTNIKKEEPKVNESFSQIFIKDQSKTKTPTVFIPGLNLVKNHLEVDKRNAIDILELKHKWPLAMKTKNKQLFEEILSKDFIIRGEDEFFGREDYINDRVHGTWTIDTVRYENLVLQFFDSKALLTYRNKLGGTDDNGIPNIEYYSWADIYTLENGQWKILSSHNIEARNEYKK